GTETNWGNIFYHTPTNYLSGTYTNWARTRATNTVPNLVSLTLTPVVFTLIPPAPINPVGWTNFQVQTNTYLYVSVLTNSHNPITNFTVDWFLDEAATQS